MSSERWKQITPSQFPWEREALDYVREHLPDCDPYRVWANFEFIADDGTINEVDILVLTPRGFFLIEIKSRPGTLSGDRATWVWTHEGRTHTEDNPIILANRKAKKLISLLKRQKACQKIRVPYLDPLVFCSHEGLDCRLQGVDRYRICLRDRERSHDRPAAPGIIAALKSRNVEGLFDNFEVLIDRPVASAISRAMEQAGIRPSQKSRRVGDYVLGNLLFESPTGTYQDWEASHSTFAKMLRRVRIYTTGSGVPAVDRETIRKAAKREFELELLSVFQSPPLFSVRHGRIDLGEVHESSFMIRTGERPVLLLGGRSWVATSIDWSSRVAYVEPTEMPGKSRWMGSGQPLSFRYCQAIGTVLHSDPNSGYYSRRAGEEMATVCEEFNWLSEDCTTVVVDRSENRTSWWTFAGVRANAMLAHALRERFGIPSAVDNLTIKLDRPVNQEVFESVIEQMRADPPDVVNAGDIGKAIKELKFSICLPVSMAENMLQTRLADTEGVSGTLRRKIRRVLS